ncbi:MAG: hypothetical protein JOY72_10140, partial [Actinobacteria bacterium]|nr:hypothetical protein [Actinomycetota bacterium]
MSLRLRLTLVAAVVVAIVVAAASLTTYFVMHHELYGQVDGSLGSDARQLQDDHSFAFRGFSNSGDVVMLLGPGAQPANGVSLPIDSTIRSISNGAPKVVYRSTNIDGFHVREVIAPMGPPFTAVVVARNIGNIDHSLSRLRLILILVSLGGVGVAALAGAFVSRATLAPVRRLTA